jgi:hypothetical protein
MAPPVRFAMGWCRLVLRMILTLRLGEGFQPGIIRASETTAFRPSISRRRLMKTRFNNSLRGHRMWDCVQKQPRSLIDEPREPTSLWRAAL